MSTTFQRKIEDFICEHCGAFNKGTGYTNHCSKCLWSKHVDIFPGDRASSCGGLMEPIVVSVKKDTYILTHRCIRCGHEKKNKTQEGDDFEALLKIVKK